MILTTLGVIIAQRRRDVSGNGDDAIGDVKGGAHRTQGGVGARVTVEASIAFAAAFAAAARSGGDDDDSAPALSIFFSIAITGDRSASGSGVGVVAAASITRASVAGLRARKKPGVVATASSVAGALTHPPNSPPPGVFALGNPSSSSSATAAAAAGGAAGDFDRLASCRSHACAARGEIICAAAVASVAVVVASFPLPSSPSDASTASRSLGRGGATSITAGSAPVPSTTASRDVGVASAAGIFFDADADALWRRRRRLSASIVSDVPGVDPASTVLTDASDALGAGESFEDTGDSGERARAGEGEGVVVVVFVFGSFYTSEWRGGVQRRQLALKGVEGGE
jgi:hypothetical protein